MKRQKLNIPYLLRLLLIILIVGLSSADKIHAQDSSWMVHPAFANRNPVPTPVQIKEEDKKEDSDNRAWRKFKHSKLIASTAAKYSLDPQLIYATIMTESDGNEMAYRFEPRLNEPSLCMGQILVSTARGMGFKGNPLEMYDPEICIDLIGKYYQTFTQNHPSLTAHQLACAYNSGSPNRRCIYGHVNRFNKWYYEES